MILVCRAGPGAQCLYCWAKLQSLTDTQSYLEIGHGNDHLQIQRDSKKFLWIQQLISPQHLTSDLSIKPELNLVQLESISVSPFKANLFPVNCSKILSPPVLQTYSATNHGVLLKKTKIMAVLCLCLSLIQSNNISKEAPLKNPLKPHFLDLEHTQLLSIYVWQCNLVPHCM